jgi:hypothetical protein
MKYCGRPSSALLLSPIAVVCLLRRRWLVAEVHVEVHYSTIATRALVVHEGGTVHYSTTALVLWVSAAKLATT